MDQKIAEKKKELMKIDSKRPASSLNSFLLLLRETNSFPHCPRKGNVKI